MWWHVHIPSAWNERPKMDAAATVGGISASGKRRRGERRSEIHERGRFTIREISFLWGLGFLGNPITGVKCDLGSWPYTVHRPSHRLSTAVVYTIGVSYLFGTDTNRRVRRYSTASRRAFPAA